MTVRDFLISLPADPDEALGQIEGALAFDGVGAALAAEDRQALVTRRAEIIKAVYFASRRLLRNYRAEIGL